MDSVNIAFLFFFLNEISHYGKKMQCFFSSHKWESSDDAIFFSLRHIMIIIISMDVSLQLKLLDTLLMFTIYKSISEWEILEHL